MRHWIFKELFLILLLIIYRKCKIVTWSCTHVNNIREVVPYTCLSQRSTMRQKRYYSAAAVEQEVTAAPCPPVNIRLRKALSKPGVFKVNSITASGFVCMYIGCVQSRKEFEKVPTAESEETTLLVPPLPPPPSWNVSAEIRETAKTPASRLRSFEKLSDRNDRTNAPRERNLMFKFW